jgi:acyl CoA:acetate/3-ketoacid CoA transferase beta subunit/acyl CoA:acetate/3-ketoacid CoA transferase alpha subunit
MEKMSPSGHKNSEQSKKIVSLKEAVAKTVKPGMSLHLGTGAYANAATREIIRQYWGKDPGFTLISSGVTTPFKIALVCSGLVKKVITTNHSYLYPSVKPISLLLNMHEEGRLEIESWSLYALEQRLMAAAMGVGFMPTKSLVGTTLGEEKRDAFKMMENPFEEGEKIGIVKALFPDISFTHGCVADSDGNVILAPPFFTSIWGPRASKGGVVATVEKIVPSEFIRSHNTLVKIPGSLVKFLCSVSLGSHPQGLAAESIGIDTGYGEDYEFILESVKAGKDQDTLKAWIDEWILKCPEQENYLRKLGPERISSVKQKSSTKTWENILLKSEGPPESQTAFNETEMMVVSAAREIKDVVVHGGFKTILTGIGSPAMGVWLADFLLKEEGIKVYMMTGSGLVGYAPRPGDPFLMTMSHVMTCSMLTDTTDIYGTFVGGAHNQCLTVLGAAQVDQYGNLNTVKINDKPLIGVGGGGDAVNARETLVVAKQSAARFLEKVDYVGISGKNIKTLVTDYGVFKKLEEDETFTLTKVINASSTKKKEDRVTKIQEMCGWPLKVADRLENVSPPTAEELAILRSLDPEGFFIGK